MTNSVRTVQLPLSEGVVRALRAGELVALDGEVFTARDAAHRRLAEALGRGEALPVDLRNATLYYTGPTPAPPGAVIGSAGPTTSSRMDAYTEPMLRAGVRGMIGKGERDEAVARALQQWCAVYFAATGGAGALLATHIAACTVVAYADLGPEAIHRLSLRQFPVLVAQDAHGGNVYARARQGTSV